MDIQDSRQQSVSDSIRIRKIYRFHVEDDLVYINHWLSLRGLAHWPKDELPKLGYVVYSNHIPVAAGFIRNCEGGIALFDSLIADPECNSEIRDECLDALVSHILRTAKEEGFIRMLAYTLNNRTLERSKNHGFSLQPHSVISVSFQKE